MRISGARVVCAHTGQQSIAAGGVPIRDAAGMENFGRARSGDISREFPSFFGIPEFRARFSTAILDHTRPIFPKISRKNGGYWLSIDAGIDRVLMRVCSGIGLGYWLSIEADNNASQFQKNCVIILHLFFAIFAKIVVVILRDTHDWFIESESENLRNMF